MRSSTSSSVGACLNLVALYNRLVVPLGKASLLVVPLEKALSSLMEFPHLSMVDRWPATPKRARTALRRFNDNNNNT